VLILFLLFFLLGSTALHSAANRGMARLAKLLMEHGASLDVKDDRGHSALCAAATLCHREVVNVFMVHCHTQGRKSLREALESPCEYKTGFNGCAQPLLFHFSDGEDVPEEDRVAMARMLTKVRAYNRSGHICH